MVKIITDTTSDITPELAQELGIEVIPLTVHFGHKAYLDRVEMSTDEFYRRLVKDDIYPTTSQPTPARFAEAYDRFGAETDEILVITISSKLSGTYQSAMEARKLAETKSRIEVVDSYSVAMALGLLAIIAAKLSQEGKTLDEILPIVRRDVTHTQPVMAFDTLKYLVKGGRVGRAQGLVGSLLSVKPILTVKDGEVSPLTRVRSHSAVMDYLDNMVSGFRNIKALAIEHATTPEAADALVKRISSFYPKEKIYRSKVSPVLGTYMGPNVLSFSVVWEEEK